MQLALNLGMERRFVIHTPLMWIDKAATFDLAHEIGGQGRSSLFWSRKPTAAISVTARFATTGAMAAENARRASCARMGLRDGRPHDDRRRTGGTTPAGGLVFLLLFALTIPAANWLIGHAGTYCVPDGPCLVPVAPGLMAPSGVTMIGLALVLRDLVQRRLGIHTAAAAILAGSLISALLALPCSSSPLRPLSSCPRWPISGSTRRLRGAGSSLRCSLRARPVLWSNSIIFLWLAFGSLEFLPGQIVGKAWMVLLSIPFVAWLRRRDHRLGLAPA